VPEDVFWKAFNHLSPVTLEGQPNPHYRPFKENARPTREEDRTEERPLCAGMILWEFEGGWRNVGTSWSGAHSHYVYHAFSGEQFDDYQWSRKASYVDGAIASLLLDKLSATFDTSIWDDTLASFATELKKQRKRIETQLAALERVMQNLSQVWGIVQCRHDQRVEARCRSALEHARLSAELADTNAEAKKLQIIVLRRELPSCA
jgi:hypothetical protein